MSSPPFNVIIAGGGTAGWMTAAALARHLPRNQYAITLIESEMIGTVGVGEATIPHIRAFNAMLGLDETEFVTRTNATFKLGINFLNWGAPGDDYTHPFGEFGVPMGGIEFHHYWLEAKRSGYHGSLDELSMANVAARANRFRPPSTQPGSPASTYTYAYHLDASLYAGMLREYSEGRGVVRKEGKIGHVSLCNNTGRITTLHLDDGSELHGDLFIDCTGFRSLLLGKCLDVPFDDWSHWLPCDRAAAIPCELAGELRPYTQSIARSSGWHWRIPLQHRMGNGHVYCSRYISDEAATQDLLEQLPGAPLADPRILRFQAGCRKKSWHRNCVALGLSSGFLEPLESTSIYLIQLGIYKLIEFFPHRDFAIECEQEFNRVIKDEYEKIRDFLILHYKATTRDDSPFWKYCRDMPVPDSLEYKISMFKNQGHIVEYQNGLFRPPSWLAILVGQGIIPDRNDPRLATIPRPQLFAELERLRSSYASTAAKMPFHAEFVDRLRASTRPEVTARNQRG